MGRKKKKPSKPWCWYCNRDFDDEKILLQHQKAKHFKCHICHKKLYTGPGLSIHCMQVHKETLDRVPNSLPNRGNIEIEIYGMEGIPESDIRDHEAQKQAGRITTAAGADSSDEEGGSSAKRAKTAQPPGQESTGPSIPSLGSMPITPMLASPFMGMGPMNPYLGHLSIPMMGSVPQMPLPGGAASSPQTPAKPLFASSSSPSSSNSASKPAFAAYSSGGAGATIVGESTVPKKSGVIATQAGSSKIMHPEEDLSLAKLRARYPRYQRNSVPTTMPQMSVASPQNTTVGPDITDIDLMPDAYSDKNVVRTKPFLFLADLSHKGSRFHGKKSQRYMWNLLIVAIFYALPVLQLVIIYKKIVNDTGDQDLCYFNFLCSHPLGDLTDFNHQPTNH
uniref:EOG090X0A5X n=1 Tax=Daphnia sinensis TaxID=1820382 RepID=A0A4Y7N8U1_9CRUS|nr:EOG090X0A5X [Daphnia sinensis]